MSDDNKNARFSASEIDRALTSIKSLLPPNADLSPVKQVIEQYAHLSHKDWARTEGAADALKSALSTIQTQTQTQHQQQWFSQILSAILRRPLVDGGWDRAEKYAQSSSSKPWVVLVTGVNGIRKTTAIYQSWFRDVLYQALQQSQDGFSVSKEELPVGNNTFFRQLDFVVASIANVDFRDLYSQPSVETYSTMKDQIYSRYRMLSEMWGALLIKEARNRNLNIMVETSGRDIAMFQYINHFFPDDSYRKLVVHFEINDLHFAEGSVDGRMKREMAAGNRIGSRASVDEIIQTNSGGPYGSGILSKVQAEEQAVWKSVVSGKESSTRHWFKANITITGSKNEWTAHVRDGVYFKFTSVYSRL